MKKMIHTIRQNWMFNTVQTVCIIAVGMFISFFMIMTNDIRITSCGSFSILSGHFLDFYDYGVTKIYSPELVYYPTMYFIWALWNVPMALIFGTNFDAFTPMEMTMVLYYDKVFVIICFFVSLYLFGKICNIILN